jgi:hypothetical protein
VAVALIADLAVGVGVEAGFPGVTVEPSSSDPSPVSGGNVSAKSVAVGESAGDAVLVALPIWTIEFPPGPESRLEPVSI